MSKMVENFTADFKYKLAESFVQIVNFYFT